jgi:hypothetical protein
MGLDDGERMIAALPCHDAEGIVLTGVTKAGKPLSLVVAGKALEAHRGNRARKGTLARSGFKPASVRKAPRVSQ